jgi:AcrR family transcriptional regulator
MARAVRAARTQEERSAATRRRLLTATISALFECGYAGTTTLEVQQRAGVSRGGLLHHYGSRTELILAAVEQLTEERIVEATATLRTDEPGEDRIEYAIRLLWGTFQGPLYAVALELWVAARNDDELRAALIPQERILGRAIRSMANELFGRDLAQHPDFAAALDVLMDAMRGAAARTPLRTAASDGRLLEEWISATRDRLR